MSGSQKKLPSKPAVVYDLCCVRTFVWQKVDSDLEKVLPIGPKSFDELLHIFVRPTVLDVSHRSAGEGSLEQVLDSLASFVLMFVQNLQCIGCDGVARGTLQSKALQSISVSSFGIK